MSHDKSNNNIDLPETAEPMHTHEFQGSTTLAEIEVEPHNHRFAGVTGPEIDVPGGHIHSVLTRTDGFDDHYHFIDKASFLNKKEAHAFIQTISLGEPGKESYYGVEASEILRAAQTGKPVVVVAEPHGVKQIYAYAQTHGWQALRVFLNNDPKRLVDRILDRFHQDTKDLDQTDPLYQKRQEQHAGRLVRVLHEEQTQWVQPALNKTDAYELIFDSFGAEEQASVVQTILEQVQTVSPKNHKKPSP